METIIVISFLVLFLILAAYVLYSIFNPNGRMHSIKTIFSANEVTDLGPIGESKLKSPYGYGLSQSLHMYKCVTEDEVFYVLETTHKTWGSMSIYYTKLTPDILNKLSTFNPLV